jgi:hypothetical protein
MQENPSWKVSSSSASQISPILWNLKFCYQIHKNPSPVPILSQSILVHAVLTNLFKFHFNIILHYTTRSLSSLCPSGPPTKTLYAPLLSLTRATCPTPLILVLIIHNIWWRAQSIKLIVHYHAVRYPVPLRSTSLPHHPTQTPSFYVFPLLWHKSFLFI